MRIIVVLILFPILSFGQVPDTLTKCKAFTNTFFYTANMGFASNGHVWNLCFNNNYDSAGNSLPITAVRIDITDGTVTYKTLTGTRSSTSFYWLSAKDTLGNLYVPMNSNNRHIWKFNLKDSIDATDLGNTFPDGQALGYSVGVNFSNHVFFGASSGGTFWSEYAPETNTVTSHPQVYSGHQYVLSIAGDNDYAYCATGQLYDNRLYSVRKSDNQTTLLFTVPTSVRFTLTTYTDAVYVQFNSDTLSGIYKLQNGTATKVNNYPALQTIESRFPSFEHWRESKYFDDAHSQVSYTALYPASWTVTKTIPVTSSYVANTVARCFSFPNDSTHIYYMGSYYGTWYDYNVTTDSSTVLGNLGANVYSILPINDSICYIGTYPSGGLFKWNRNHDWTLSTYQDGVPVNAANSNPRFCGYFRNTPAGFHHCTLLIQDNYGNIVGAGDVIRVNNTCSIGVYNPTKDSMYGYDYNKMISQSESNVTLYQDWVLLSTNNTYGGTPKIYFYNSATNRMDDSATFNNYKNFGNITAIGNTLIGSTFGDASNGYLGKLYKYNLKTRTVLFDSTLNANLGSNGILSDGKFYVYTTATNLPNQRAYWPTVSVNYSGFSSCANWLCRCYNNSIIAVKNLLGGRVDLNTAKGKVQFTKNILNLP